MHVRYIYFFLVKREICQVNTCQNGGVCVQDLDTVHCTCNDGFKGRLCEGLFMFITPRIFYMQLGLPSGARVAIAKILRY
jgi:EGF-like domain.